MRRICSRYGYRSLHQLQQPRKGKKVISFSQPLIFKEEEESLLKVLRSGRLVMGPNVEKFEEMVANFSGQKHAIAVTSGTSALTLALTAMGVNNNSFTVVPAYTWVATYNAPKLLGSTVRLADIDPNTFCFNPLSTKQVLENNTSKQQQQQQQQQQQNSVVIPVHMFGNRCSSDLGSYDTILGDGCCAFGGKDVDGKRCGNWNDVECFSFHPRKLITTGEGGMVLCSDDQFANTLRLQRDHGALRSKEQRYQTVHGGDMIPEFPEVGYNMRLTDLQGALGVSQMNRIDMIIDTRRKVAARYDHGFQELAHPDFSPDAYLKLPTPDHQPGGLGERVLTMYTLQLRSKKLDDFISSISSPSSSSLQNSDLKIIHDEISYLRQIKTKLMSLLVNDGITSRPPMISLLDVHHIQKDHFSHTGVDLLDDMMKLQSFPGTFITSQLSFALPLHPLLTSDEVDYVIDRVRYHLSCFSSPSSSSPSSPSTSPHLLKSFHLSSQLPHDFTIQYPIRREYFKSNFLMNVPSTQPTSRPPSPSPPPSSPSPLPTSSSQSPSPSPSPSQQSDRLKGSSSILPPPRDLIANKELLLYAHIPFCKSKCHYCNFAIDTRKSTELKDKYTLILSQQLQHWSNLILDPELNIQLSGIDIGGGTPTLLSEKQLELILSTLQPLIHKQEEILLNKREDKKFNPSYVSIETTPEIAATEPSKLHLLYQGGIRRISVGIQTSHTGLLCSVNRQKNEEISLKHVMSNLHSTGFQRINLDLIFGLPGQSFDHWMVDLAHVVELSPDSITTYDCVYKGKGRGVNSIMRREDTHRPTHEEYGMMYNYTYEYLHSKGYHAPYGSINFSRYAQETGTSCYFEKRLLHGVNYIGVGNYASSLIDRYWMFSPYSIEGWFDELFKISSSSSSPNAVNWPIYNAYNLPIEERVAKYVLSSLSFGFIDENYFEKAFPSWSLQNFYFENLNYLVEVKKWMTYLSEERRYYLNRDCFQYLPQIRSSFHTQGSLVWFENNVMRGKEIE